MFCFNGIVSSKKLSSKVLYSKKKAFTIFEKTIVISLVGILIGCGLFAFHKIQKYSYHRITVNRINVIREALDKFFIENNRLPCPALSTDRVFTENCSDAMEITSTFGTLSSTVKIKYGKVPTETLGLTQDMVVDGYENFFSYNVLSSLTTEGTRYYKNATPTTFQINYSTPNEAFNDVIIADKGTIGEAASVISDDIVQFLKVISIKKSDFVAQTRQNLIDYANSNVAIKNTDGRIISLEALYTVVSHGFDGYCAYNSKTLALNTIPANVLSQNEFYFNDYVNCVNYHSVNATATLNSRSFVISNDVEKELRTFANDIVVFSNFRNFYDSFSKNNLVDCAWKLFKFNQPTNNSSYEFYRTKSSTDVIAPNIIKIGGKSASSCSDIARRYPLR